MKTNEVKDLAGKLMQAAYITMKVMESFDCVTTQYKTLEELDLEFYPEDAEEVNFIIAFLQDEIPIYYKDMKIDQSFPATVELII